jgi:hypothetical protein
VRVRCQGLVGDEEGIGLEIWLVEGGEEGRDLEGGYGDEKDWYKGENLHCLLC